MTQNFRKLTRCQFIEKVEFLKNFFKLEKKKSLVVQATKRALVVLVNEPQVDHRFTLEYHFWCVLLLLSKHHFILKFVLKVLTIILNLGL